MDRRAVALTCALTVTSLTVALLPATASSARVGSSRTLSSLEWSLVAQVNEIRVAHGLVPLTLSTGLTVAAGRHCADMVETGVFGHEVGGEAPLLRRLERSYPPARYRYYEVGENLLRSSSSIGGSSVADIWMKSPEHRANILLPEWREIGVSALSVAAAPGVFDDRPVTVITTEFGVRR